MAMKLAVDHAEDNQPAMAIEIAVNHAENKAATAESGAGPVRNYLRPNPPELSPAIKCGAMNTNHGLPIHQGSRNDQDSLANQGILNELRQQGCSSH